MKKVLSLFLISLHCLGTQGLPKRPGKRCDPPDDPKIFIASQSAHTPYKSGDSILVKCKPQYEAVDHKENSRSLECNDRGDWDGEFPNCQETERFPDQRFEITPEVDPKKKSCTVPNNPNLKISGISNNPEKEEIFHKKDVIKATCVSGYKPVNEITLECTEKGTWNDTFPECKTWCPRPRSFDNGRWYLMPEDERVQAYFQCDEGYVLSSGLQGWNCISKRHNHFWVGEEPECTVTTTTDITCPNPPIMENGIIRPMKFDGRQYFMDEEIQIDCDTGFKPIGGSAQLICGEDGKWDDDIPVCRDVTCEKPKSPKNGFIVELLESKEEEKVEAYSFGDHFTYDCHKGFNLVGAQRRTCQAEGWSDKEPICEAIKCKEIPFTENGRFTSTFEGILPGEEVAIKCNIGHVPKKGGRSYVLCMDDGTWDMQYSVCEEITCQHPGELKFGKVSLEQTESGLYPFATVAHFSCKEAYQLVGSSKRSCRENGWNGVEPKCVEAVCEKPFLGNIISIIDWDRDSDASFQFGDKVTFGCPKNYELRGSKTIECRQDGWSGTTPYCHLRGCPEPLPEDNYSIWRGRFEKYYYFGWSYDAVCKEGFRLESQRRVRCNQNGEWQFKPKCKEIRCKKPTAPNNGRIIGLPEGQTSFPIKYKLELECDVGYKLKSYTRICSSRGWWEGPYENCTKKKCQHPTADIGQWVKVKHGDNFVGDQVELICFRGYNLVGDGKKTCLETELWSDSNAYCEEGPRCPIPHTPLNAHVKESVSLIPGTILTLVCDEGFVAKNPDVQHGIMCTDDGPTWHQVGLSGTALECVETEANKFAPCQEPYFLINGVASRHLYSNDFLITCDPGYINFGAIYIRCREDRSWYPEQQEYCTESHNTAICERLPLDEIDVKNKRDLKRTHRAGSKVEYSCKGSTSAAVVRITEKRILECDYYGRWSDSGCTSDMGRWKNSIQCEELPANINILGGSSDESYESGAKIWVTCKSSSHSPPSSKQQLECDSKGRWKIEDINCATKMLPDSVECEELPDNIEIWGGRPARPLKPGSKISVYCKYISSPAHRQIECDPNGRWIINNIKCPTNATKDTTTCEKLPNNIVIWERQRVETYTPGSKIMVSCKFIHPQPQGPTYLLDCNSNGRWNTEIIVCPVEDPRDSIKCDKLPENLINRESQLVERYMPGSSIQVSCKSSASTSINPTQILKCDSDGRWNIKEIECPVKATSSSLCGTLPVVKNALIAVFEQSTDHLKIICNKGYRLEGKEDIICQSLNRQWSKNFGSCVAISCERLPILKNAEYTDKNETLDHHPGNSVRVSCKRGYTSIGENSIRCLDNGTWDESKLLCQAKVTTCSVPEPVENGAVVEVEEGTSTFVLDSEAHYQCNEGFRLVGDDTRICLESGWSKELPVCEAIICSLPEDQNEYLPGTKVDLTCPHGKRPKKGHNEVTCQKDGTWDFPLPHCEDISCNTPDIPNFAIMNNDDQNLKKFPLGYVVQFSCKSGFKLEGESTINCTENGWSNPTLKCKAQSAKSCNVRRNIPNGSLSVPKRRKASYKVGDTLSASCNRGYKLQNKGEKYICNENGQWTGPPCIPVSQKVHCPLPSEIPANSKIENQKTGQYEPGEELQVFCDVGYQVESGNDFLYCMEDGKWDDEFPVCKLQKCRAPQEPDFGTYEEYEEIKGSEVEYGYEINYQCEPGYQIIGSRVLKCRENGWFGVTPVCKKVQCTSLEFPESGYISGSSYNVGDKVTFSCFVGYELLGSKERICEPHGQWSGELTRCEGGKTLCPNPGKPVNGIRSGNSFRFGETVQFSCYSGYSLIGPNKRTCKNDGTWTGEEPKCIGKHQYDDPSQVSREFQQLAVKLSALQKRIDRRKSDNVLGANGDKKKYKAMTLYFLFDASGSIGNKNFRRSINFAKSIIKMFDEFNSTYVAAASFSSDSKVALEPTSLNNKDTILSTLDNIPYEEGGTSIDAAFTVLKDELIPSARNVIGKESQSVVFLLTDGKFKLGSNPIKITRELFKGHSSFIYCIGLTGYPHKDILYSIANTAGRSGKVFFLDSFATMDKIAKDISEKSLNYSTCGTGLDESWIPKPDDTSLSVGESPEERLPKMEWPWMVLFHYEHSNTTVTFCSGSLINENWVLTSSKCFDIFRAGKTKGDVYVTVGIGASFSSVIKEVVPHPEVEGVKTPDVVLVRLKETVEFGPNVRPVCIPNSKSKASRRTSQLAYFVSAEQIGLQVFQNKPRYLEIQERGTCIKSFGENKDLFRDELFCTGPANENLHTCFTDLGGPLLVQTEKSWQQIGLLTYLGKNCADGKMYDTFLDVAKISPWINNIVR